jgi:tol-pal system protein YbgF
MKVKLIIALSVIAIAPLTMALPSIEDGSNNSAWVSSSNSFDTTGADIAITQDQSLNLAQRVSMVQRSLSNINQMDFPSQIQSLEQELQSMQGSIEELNHKLGALKRQQEKQYDLLSQKLVTSAPEDVATQAMQAQEGGQELVPAAGAAAVVAATTATSVSAFDAALPPEQQEQKTYEAAFSLITSHAYDDAIEAMQSCLKIYGDDGKYAANAYYWLGELYAQKKDYANALSHLETVVQQYPDSNKAPDAMLKLGIINQQQGNDAQAKKWFDEVTSQYPDSSSARLAKNYL